jgi:hypothetical protein
MKKGGGENFLQKVFSPAPPLSKNFISKKERVEGSLPIIPGALCSRLLLTSLCTKFKPDFCALHQTKKFFQIPLAICRILRYYMLVILCQSVSIRALMRKFQNHGGTPT